MSVDALLDSLDNDLALQHLYSELSLLDPTVVAIAQRVASTGKGSLVALAKASSLIQAIGQLEGRQSIG